jgi:hypothetical protein
MQSHEIVDRLTILYGNKYPVINSLERVANTEVLSDIFVLSSYLLGKKHRETVSALKNLIYERKPEDNIFVLFKVIEPIADDNEALHALRNVVNGSNFVNLQTELLFKLITNLDNRNEEIISAIKNLVSSSLEPDMFLLFKVLQAIDTENEWIKTLKSVTIYKTNILKLAHKLTEEKYTLPINMGKMIKRFEGQALTDAFSRGQLRSKLWVSDTVNDLGIDLGDMVYVCAGWYGVLSSILFERNKVENILSFDSDDATDNPADTLNKEKTIDGLKFKAVVKDIHELKYKTESFDVNHYQYSDVTEFKITKQSMPVKMNATCVINTSCEHIENFDKWWAGIPDDMLVIMQNNDFDDDEAHQHAEDTVTSLEEFSNRLNLSENYYEGTLALEEYNRYMVIGRK